MFFLSLTPSFTFKFTKKNILIYRLSVNDDLNKIIMPGFLAKNIEAWLNYV